MNDDPTPSPMLRWRSPALLTLALVFLSALAVETPERAGELATVSPEAGASSTGETGALDPGVVAEGGITEGGTSTAEGGVLRSSSKARAALECKAGRNGGATDKGVTADKIKLAATNVRSGTGASFLGTSYIGMQAVVNRVNAKGGICGRLLELRLVDDGWEAARGATFLQNFTKGDVFALPVVPSSEGLTQSILNKTISGSGTPVIGSDGMLKEQYSDPWVWPVATSTVSTIRIMTKHASDQGAKSFGIVFDQQYKFGLEGASAFREYVRELTGANPKAYIGITPKKANYSSEAQQFNDACGADGCDFVAMLLTPETATTYIASQSEANGKKRGFGRLLTGGAQPLFNERFGRDCGRFCDGMLVWTGYNPPIGGLSSLPAVAAYVNDVRSVDPGVDVNNQFLEGAYLGMQVFVHALEKVGPNLTRARLREVMNSLTYASELASPLTWKPNAHFANTTAQAFRIVTASGSFAGFGESGSGFIRDPKPGVVPR